MLFLFINIMKALNSVHNREKGLLVQWNTITVKPRLPLFWPTPSPPPPFHLPSILVLLFLLLSFFRLDKIEFGKLKKEKERVTELKSKYTKYYCTPIPVRAVDNRAPLVILFCFVFFFFLFFCFNKFWPSSFFASLLLILLSSLQVIRVLVRVQSSTATQKIYSQLSCQYEGGNQTKDVSRFFEKQT